MKTRDKVRQESRTHKRELHQRPVSEREIEPLEVYIQRRMSSNDNPLHIPPECIPHGWTYNWFRKSCYGKEDPHNIPRRRQQGWSPVPASRHPELCIPDSSGNISQNGPLEINEQMLFEKPTAHVEVDRKMYRDRIWRQLMQIEALQRDATLYHGLNLRKVGHSINYEDFSGDVPMERGIPGEQYRNSPNPFGRSQGAPIDGFGY